MARKRARTHSLLLTGIGPLEVLERRLRLEASVRRSDYIDSQLEVFSNMAWILRLQVRTALFSSMIEMQKLFPKQTSLRLVHRSMGG